MNFSNVPRCLLLPLTLVSCSSADLTDTSMSETGEEINEATGGTETADPASGGLSSTGGTSTGANASTGGVTSSGGAPTSGGSTSTGGTTNTPVTVRVMSLNVYGHATMPQEAPTYAALIESHNIDVVGIQEGVNDWMIATDLPTDYSRADALGDALGECWDQQYQVFVNTCHGFELSSHERFDLTDGPNATRTGERAIINKDGTSFTFIDIHWDHEDSGARSANANETAASANNDADSPTVVLGDFNAGCEAGEPTSMATQASLSLIANAGIDCIFTRNTTGVGMQVSGAPSDHPAVLAELSF